jgi:hypothetical protein
VPRCDVDHLCGDRDSKQIAVYRVA